MIVYCPWIDRPRNRLRCSEPKPGVRAGHSISADALIAGIAKANDLSVVTRNVRDFDGLDIEIVNPWEAE